MANTPTDLFDGPFSQPMREADRFKGYEGTTATPERLASGNLPSNPTDNPVRNPTPFRKLSNGR